MTNHDCRDCTHHVEDEFGQDYLQCGCFYAFNHDLEGTHEDTLLWHQHKLSCPQMGQFHGPRPLQQCRWWEEPNKA